MGSAERRGAGAGVRGRSSGQQLSRVGRARMDGTLTPTFHQPGVNKARAAGTSDSKCHHPASRLLIPGHPRLGSLHLEVSLGIHLWKIKFGFPQAFSHLGNRSVPIGLLRNASCPLWSTPRYGSDAEAKDLRGSQGTGLRTRSPRGTSCVWISIPPPLHLPVQRTGSLLGEMLEPSRVWLRGEPAGGKPSPWESQQRGRVGSRGSSPSA